MTQRVAVPARPSYRRAGFGAFVLEQFPFAAQAAAAALGRRGGRRSCRVGAEAWSARAPNLGPALGARYPRLPEIFPKRRLP